MGFHSKAHTILTTELFNIDGSRKTTTAPTTDWTDMPMPSDIIPSSAKRIETYLSSQIEGIDNNGDIRCLYNGVEKVTRAVGTANVIQGIGWEGAGLGSEALLKWEGKVDEGSHHFFNCGACWYQTI